MEILNVSVKERAQFYFPANFIFVNVYYFRTKFSTLEVCIILRKWTNNIRYLFLKPVVNGHYASGLTRVYGTCINI